MTATAKALEFVSIAGLLFMIYLTASNWHSLPDRASGHFGLPGLPDFWDGKGILWVMPGAGVFVYALMSIVGRFPGAWNFPVEITEQNARREYAITRSMLYWLKAEIVWIFAYTEWATIQVASKQKTGPGAEFILLMLLTLFGTIGISFWLARKAK